MPLALGLAHYCLLPGDIGLKTPYEPSLWEIPPAAGIWVGPSGVAEARRLTGSNLVVGYKFLISALLLSVWISATLELRYLELYRRRGCNRCLAGKAREDGKSFFFFFDRKSLFP